MAELDLCCYAQAFSSCSEWGLLCCVVWASHFCGFSCCGAQALGFLGFSSCSGQAQSLQSVVSRAQTQ